MDRAALVAYRIDYGRKLLNRLLQDGLDVTVAFWMYTNDDESWTLYIVSESLDSIGIRESYMKVVLARRSMPELRLDPPEVSLLEPTSPLAAAILKQIRACPAGSDAWIEGSTRNGIYIEIAYIYPLPTLPPPGESGPAMIEEVRLRAR